MVQNYDAGRDRAFRRCDWEHSVDGGDDQGHEHSKQVPELLGTTENELGIRKWLEDQGHTLITTSDKEGENSKFDQELVDAEVIITTP